MSPEERAKRPTRNIINQIAQFVRTDRGGQDYLEAAIESAKKFAKSQGETLSEKGYKLMALFGMQEAERCKEGIKKRVQTPIDELRRRLGANKLEDEQTGEVGTLF